ncbi:putative quinol monooxygenase [Persicobacter sp. CCB-QB2]|uniref:putative quinol monooxygenase n=1 Tax=Persicobacter sp. CCB-QB2 TaxID=1561025 RepID=UPI0006A9BE94|nr:putative quinol monooxygenase [Persicobacter sp. CCB-QB2]
MNYCSANPSKRGQRAFVKKELLKLIEVTRAEKACINYNLHQDNENPDLFLFFEKWENRELWQTHMQNEHLKRYMEVTEGAVEEFVLHEMMHIAQTKSLL